MKPEKKKTNQKIARDAIPAGISANRPEISRRASAQRDVESAIILTWYPISRKYSDNVIPGKQE